jgi:uncharacterized protein YqhQ
MENLENNQNQGNTAGDPGTRIPLPNATASLVLGIFSIVTSWCCGFIAIIGLTLGIVGLVLGSKALNMYQQSPEKYTINSQKNANAGKICSIIGIAISGVLILIGLIYILFLGATLGTIFSTIPWENYLNNL